MITTVVVVVMVVAVGGIKAQWWLMRHTLCSCFSQHFGFFFIKREPGKVTIRIDGQKTAFQTLHVLEFTRYDHGGGCNRSP